MKHPTLAFLCVALLAVACGRDRSSNSSDVGDNPESDASTAPDAGGGADASTDASLPPDASLPDGGEPDMGIDNAPAFVPSFPGLDTSFGRGGLQTIGNPAPFAGPEALWDIELTDDGKIVAFGRNFQALGFVRLTRSGALDSTFGEAGYRLLPYGDERVQFDVGFGGFGISSEGKYVFASDVQLGAIRYAQLIGGLDGDGGLDPLFGDDGTVYFEPPFDGLHVSARVGFQSSGKFVVAFNPAELRRFDADGTPDTTFGNNRSLPLDFARRTTFLGSLNVLEDDRLVVGGSICCDDALAVAVVTAEGALDTSFGGTGFVIDEAAEGFQTSVFDAIQTTDGKILVAAARPHLTDRDSHFAVGRYLADGSLDATFGEAGWVLDDGDNSGRALELAVQSDGKILAAGRGSWDAGTGGLVRLNGDGTYDTSFDGDGIIAAMGVTTGVALQSDGRIVLLERNGVRGFASDGSVDATFGTDGATFLTTLRSPDVALTAVSDAQNNIVVAGSSADNPGYYLLARLNAAGVLDPTFGDAGVMRAPDVLRSVRTLAVDTQGRILAGGVTDQTAGADLGFRFARLAADGTLDSDFSSRAFTAGTLTSATSTRTTDIAYLDDSTIFVGGIYDAGGETRFAILKLDVDGNVDSTFGNQGVATSTAITQSPFLRVGNDGAPYGLFGDRIVKFTPTGQLDATFGQSGELIVPIDDFAIDADGSLYVLSLRSLNDVRQLRITAFDANGNLDTTYGTGGEILAPIGEGDVSSIVMRGEYVVAAGWTADHIRSQGVLVAFDRSGSPVSDFGNAGRIDAIMSHDRSTLRGLTVDPSGRLVAVGSAWSSIGGDDFAVIRLE